MNTDIHTLIATLNDNIGNVEFFYAFPNKAFTVPLSDSFACSVTAIREKNTCSDNTDYLLELVAPLRLSGKDVFDKADEIGNFLIRTQKNITCRIEDMAYIKLKRCYSLKIRVTAQKPYFQECSVIFSENITDAVITAIQTKYNSCDIMVYGMSRPFDTLLENCVYHIELQTTTPFPQKSAFTVSYDNGSETVCFTQCKINSVCVRNTNSTEIFLYNITACERSVI